MLLAKNRKATYNYEIIDKYLAGIVLKGYEVKAIREKKVNFEGAYVKVEDGEVYVVNMHIGRYSNMSQEYNDQMARAPRKLLLNSREIDLVTTALQQKGKTAVPLALVLRNNQIKLEFAVVKGRKALGKKQLEKDRQLDKELDKIRKEVERSY